MKAYSKMVRPLVIWQDRLAITIINGNGLSYTQGKRISKDCPVSKAVCRMYVKYGTAKAVKLIMNETGFNLKSAIILLNQARGKEERFRKE